MAAPGLAPGSVGALIVYIVAIISGTVRLVYRHRRGQLYWDDFFAFIALITAIILMGILIAVAMVDMDAISLRTQSFLRWGPYPLNSIAVWSSRLSIGVTVLRIIPPGRARQITLAGNAMLFLMWIGILLENILFCGTPIPLIPTCETAETSFPVAGITINFVASTFLVCWPAYILISHRWRLVRMNKLSIPSVHHHLLLACFSTNILLFVADLVHYLAFIQPDILYRRLTGHFESSISVFLCSLLVLATSLYRFINHHTIRGKENSNDMTLSSMRGGTSTSQVQKVHIVRETHTYTVVSGPDGRMSIKQPSDMGVINVNVTTKVDEPAVLNINRNSRDADDYSDIKV